MVYFNIENNKRSEYMEQDIINILNNQDKPSLTAIEINDELGFTMIED